MHRHMKITYRAHRGKWRISYNPLVSGTPQSHLSLITHQVMRALPFWNIKELAYNMYSYA
jgi:hypothetical protein